MPQYSQVEDDEASAPEELDAILLWNTNLETNLLATTDIEDWLRWKLTVISDVCLLDFNDDFIRELQKGVREVLMITRHRIPWGIENGTFHES